MEAFVFPGQGSQFMGMGKVLYETFPTYRHTIEEAEDILSRKIKDLIENGPNEVLLDTQNTQICLFTVSTATLRVFLEQSQQEIIPVCTAGHSLGEYNALIFTQTLSFKDALKLIAIRGQAMKNAYPVGGAMGAIIGLDEKQVENFLDENCVIANDNSIGQIVISGLELSVEQVLQKAKSHGAKLIKKLNVSGPFHSPWMQKAADTMKGALKSVDIKKPTIPYYPNVLATPITDKTLIKDLLVAQITGRVRFRETILNMHQQSNIDTVYEIGPGKVLQGLIKRTCPEIQTYSLNDPLDIENCLERKIKHATQ